MGDNDDQAVIDKLLKRLDNHLGVDIEAFKLGRRKSESTIDNRNDFFDYLVSVATRSIGLRSSIKPFNETKEHILAYIMDMFNITNQITSKHIELGTLKRHSWRPELRIRLNKPPFLGSKVAIDRLFVRVYLFKDEQIKLKSDIDRKQLNPMEKMFLKYKLRKSMLTRPINEVRAILKFISNEDSSDFTLEDGNQTSYKSVYKMVHVKEYKSDLGDTSDDLKLNLRRYYCEPETEHFLRFEFWIQSNKHQPLRRLISRLIYNGCFASSGRSHKNQDQQFYGFINIMLTQLPSYSTKQRYPILTLLGRKLNHCEISLEVRNRRIQDNTSRQVDNSNRRRSKGNFVIYHIRLYANCLMYQYKSLLKEQIMSMNILAYITLDNLLYIPAYSLLNQHRLQSNLSQLEDRHLRRVSILRLFLIIDNHAESNLDVEQIQMMLLGILQNEYIIATNGVDDKTMNEIDPFGDSIDQGIFSLEIHCLKELVEKSLTRRLEIDFIERQSEQNNTQRSISLGCLKVLKLAIIKFKTNLQNLEKLIDDSLRRIIIRHISNEIIIGLEEAHPEKDTKSWSIILSELKSIDNNLKLFWNQLGLSKLLQTNQTGVGIARVDNLFEEKFRKKLDILIKDKMDRYLSY